MRQEPRACRPLAAAVAHCALRPLHAGTELPPSEYRARLSRAPVALPEDAGAGAAWETCVDSAWQRRESSGDGVALLVGRAKVEAAVEAFVEANIKRHDEKKCARRAGQSDSHAACCGRTVPPFLPGGGGGWGGWGGA
jgi:hypothetical protein